MVPCSDKERDEDYVLDHESEDESDEEVEEDEEVHEAELAPHLEYDKLDLPMIEGRKYPNMAEFKLALSQHAIKHEFEFNTEKSAPHRSRAYCSRRDEDKCPWTIYASTMEDGCTVMVRKNSCGHDCSSTKRKKKIKNATKRWICEHVKDWLIDDATLGPKALRKKLKEHHGINIKYKRVYMEDHQRRGQRPPNQLNHQLCLARMMLHQPYVFRQAKSWRKQPSKKGKVVNLDPEEQKDQEHNPFVANMMSPKRKHMLL
nr:uncharacterized protein LOC109761194 [Aegilops tauschii subsp. strangulata]